LIEPTGNQITKMKMTIKFVAVPTMFRYPMYLVAFMVRRPSKMRSARSRR
jgi:hypothetical protein